MGHGANWTNNDMLGEKGFVIMRIIYPELSKSKYTRIKRLLKSFLKLIDNIYYCLSQKNSQKFQNNFKKSLACKYKQFSIDENSFI